MKNGSALVAYATETGNAYDYAEELGRLLRRIHFRPHVLQLNDILNTRYLKEYDLVFIVVSTTGQGELPANGRSFWKSLLRKNLPPDHLENLPISTFGLGDSSYPKFNWAARKVHKRLLQLGAYELYPRGEADEQHNEGLDASFVPWSSDLRTHLLAKYPLPANVEPVSEDTFLEPTWKLALQSGVQNGVGYGATTVPPSIPASHLNPQSQTKGPQKSSSTGMLPLPVTLQNNSRMTPQNHWQDVRHLVFTSELHADYGPGDILTIHPENQEVDVEQLLIRMNWVDVADKPIIYSPTNASDTNDKAFLSSPKHTAITTLRSLLRTQLDITAIPRRSFFSFIAHFTDDQFHKDRLLEFTKPDYIDEFYDYTTRPRRSILEVLQEFESVNVPWQWAGSVFPELRGRQFSIASGGIHKTTLTGTARFELLVAIVKYRTVIKKMREGVCTRYLSSLAVGTRLDVTLQKGSLAIKKKDTNLPVIMIGPGTGVAPMRSLIWERRHWLQDEYRESLAKTIHDIDRNPAKNILFFGCRNESADYFYREEWEDIQKSVPLEVYAAFSRDQRQKVYVQDLIRKNSRSVFYVLHNDGGLVYVSGSSGKMPLAVRAALVDVFRECGNMDQGTAEEYLESLEKGGRYRQETW